MNCGHRVIRLRKGQTATATEVRTNLHACDRSGEYPRPMIRMDTIDGKGYGLRIYGLDWTRTTCTVIHVNDVRLAST